MTAKSDLYLLIDQLPEDAAVRLLALLADPVERSLLLAPEDDEPETEDERAAVAEAWAEYQRGEGRPLEDVLADLERERA